MKAADQPRAGDAVVREGRSEAMLAVCLAAGWTYCAEHDRPLDRGSAPCRHLHPAEPLWPHAYYCSWPDGECLGAPCEEVQRGIG